MASPRTPLRMARILRAGAAAALAAGLIAGSGGAARADTTPSPEPIERTECPVPVPDEYSDRVECGVLVVPESRAADADPERTLRLPYAVIASTSREPAEDPLVFPTAGGPGGGSVNTIGYWLENGAWATATRDVILLEQRGDLLAEPTLDCPELDPAAFIEDGRMLSGSAAADRRQAQLTACRDRLVDDGVALSAYTSSASAGDLADLRNALGYDSWNMYGISYGSRLALTVMRDRPQGLRAVILDGPYPPQIDKYEQIPAGFESAVQHLLLTCEEDASCHDRYPDLATQLEDALAAAAREPLTVTIDSPVDDSALTVEYDDTALARGLFQALYYAGDIGALPFVIDQVASGNGDAALPLIQRDVWNDGYSAEGLYYSIECAEEVPFNSAEAVAEAEAATPLTSHLTGETTVFDSCALWDVPALGDIETAVVNSDIPTLITTGGFDPITPLAWGEAAEAGLSNATLVSFPRAAHGAIWQNWVDPCASRLAALFLQDPTAELALSCTEETPAVEFLSSADILPTSALFRLDRDLIQQREPLQIAIAGTSIVLMIATLVYGAVVTARRRLHLRGDIPAGTVLAAVTTAALNLAYATGLALVMVNGDPLALAFGLPSFVWPMLLLPFAGLVTAVLLVVLLVRAWVTDDGTLFHRIVPSVSAVASLTFTLWLLGRGLMFL